MLLYFPTRTKAREFAKKSSLYKFTDTGDGSPTTGRRWAVDFTQSADVGRLSASLERGC